MDTRVLSYLDVMKLKVKTLKDIYHNTLAQSDALRKNDHALLATLLKQREDYIQTIRQGIQHSKDALTAEKNEETEKYEKAIKFLFHEIMNLNNKNIKTAESQKDDMSRAVRNLELGKYAIQHGYFKRTPQLYGYFIDKKIK